MLFTFQHHGRAFAIETSGFLGSEADPHEAADHLAGWVEAHRPAHTDILHTALSGGFDGAGINPRLADLQRQAVAAAIAEALAATLGGHEVAPGQAMTLRAAIAEQITTEEARNG